MKNHYNSINKVYRKKLESCLNVDFFELFRIIEKTKGIIWIIGNGGSLAVAEHAALDLTKAAGKKSFAITDPAAITAYSNDISFNLGIENYLASLWHKGDIVVALSTSGESTNIIMPIKRARTEEIFTCALTSKGSSLAKEVDLAIEFDEEDPKVLEDIFGITLHMIVKILEVINDSHKNTSEN